MLRPALADGCPTRELPYELPYELIVIRVPQWQTLPTLVQNRSAGMRLLARAGFGRFTNVNKTGLDNQSSAMKITAYISDILSGKTGEVWTIESRATVFEAITRMAEKNIGAMPVVDDGQLVGLISERDYTRKIALMGKSSRETTVGEIMASPVITVTPNATVDTCMQLVSRKRVRHLPVVEGDRLVGMISIGDLVNWTISAQSAAIEQMESYIMGGYAT